MEVDRMRAKLTATAFSLIMLAALPMLATSATGTDASPQAEAQREPQYRVCREQIERFVTGRFQQTVTEVQFDFVFDYRSMGNGGDGSKSAAIVYTRECPGYHVFDLFATDYDCESRVHYGDVPNYIFYRISERGC